MKAYLAILLGTFCVFSNSIASEEWTHYTVLDGEGRYHLYWRPPETKDGDSEIMFKVEVEAHGYIGFGLSPNGGMAGSDIVTGWMKNETPYFQDRFATGDTLPKVDKRKDWNLLEASENDTHTILKFSRKLDTCDEEDMVIDDSTMRVIYAYSEQDPEGDHPFYHELKRGSKSVLLLQSKLIEGEQFLDDPFIRYWDVKLQNHTVPNVETIYWCKIFRTPQLSKKNHIIYVKPVIQEGNEKVVHHMLLYECVGATPDEYEEHVELDGHECYHPNMPDALRKCDGVTIAWAIGGNDVAFPEHVGLPLDPAPGKYFLLEMHYDNPQRRAGIVDGSGLRIYYTPDLRKYDAGCLMLGAAVRPSVFIPPGQEKYTVTGHSNPECLAPEIPEGGLKALGVLLHSHLAGRQLKARHFRKNKELPPLAVEKNYDFNYQEYRYYTKEVDILQGDQITVECTYDTSHRTKPTFGGISTQEEMCLAFVLYYPRIDRYGSQSYPTHDNINEALNTNLTVDDLYNWKIYSSLREVDWDEVNINEVEHSMRYTKHGTLCNLGNGEKSTIKSLISYPEDIVSHVAERSCGSMKNNNFTSKKFGTEVNRANLGIGSRSALNLITWTLLMYLIICI